MADELTFSLTIRVDLRELQGWPPRKVDAFFSGLAGALIAQQGSAAELETFRSQVLPLLPQMQGLQPQARVIAQWPAIPNYYCRHCGDEARRNPDDVREWGCAHCAGSSFSVYFNFMHVPKENVISIPRKDPVERTDPQLP
jgi:hypothetical protein